MYTFVGGAVHPRRTGCTVHFLSVKCCYTRKREYNKEVKNSSTIFCSQFAVAGWREKIGDPILADAICDRIVHDSYQMVIDCKESMRKRKGVQEQGD